MKKLEVTFDWDTWAWWWRKLSTGKTYHVTRIGPLIIWERTK